MKIFTDSNSVKIEDVKNFDPGQTFDCGQCFRFKEISENYYIMVAFKKALKIKKENNLIIFENTNKEDFENIWKDFFDLKTDYNEIWKSLKNISPLLKEAYYFAPGIRILRQEPWETLCSYIISQNNNIPRIKKIISKLCTEFGERIENTEYFSFPSAKTLACKTEKDLEIIKAGFRAKYIIDAAKKVANKEVNLEIIKNLPNEEAKENLMKIKGVGEKVASCTLLYGFHRLDVFPIDVWIKKVMEKYFKGKSHGIFGKYAGVAQQYLYHYSRENSGKLF